VEKKKVGFAAHPGNINKKGRPLKPEIQILRDAIDCVRQEKGMHPIEKFVRDAYDDPTLMQSLMRKILPDLKSIDLAGTGEDGNIIFKVIIENGNPKITRTEV
jgi:hypothetical protein